MKKLLSVILSTVILLGAINVCAVSYGNMTVGTLPNGRAINASEAIEIQAKLDSAMQDAYTETIIISRDDILNNNVPEIISDEECLKNLINENLIQMTCKTYYLKTDEDGIQIPITKSEMKQKGMGTQEYSLLTMVASVVDDGSTSSIRKYFMTGGAVMDERLNNTTDLNDSVSISWAGGEAISSDLGLGQYYTGTFGDKTSILDVYGWRDQVVNNGAVSYKFNGKYSYYLIARDPYSLAVSARVQQNGKKSNIVNMTSTYVQTWLSSSYSFSVGSGGVSMSVSPVTGSATYTATCTY